MMEKILLGSSYLAQAIVMATIAFAVISTIYYLRYNKKIICQPGWIIKYIFLVYIATVGMVTRVLDITSWSYGGFTAWNIIGTSGIKGTNDVRANNVRADGVGTKVR